MTPALVVDLVLRAHSVDTAIAQRLTGGTHPAAFFGRLPRQQFLIKLWAAATFIASNHDYPMGLRIRGFVFVRASLASLIALMVCVVALVVTDGGA